MGQIYIFVLMNQSLRTAFKNQKEIHQYYRDEVKCRALLEQQRWNGNPCCPHCGAEKPYRTNRGFKCREKECAKKFTVMVGTIFENTKIKLNVWFEAMYYIANHKKGISSCQLARDLGITQKSAWFILHRVREMLNDNETEFPTEITMVEVDETFVGGKNKNRHKVKKVPQSQGRSHKDKTPVFGIAARNGRVVAIPVIDTKRETLQPIIHKLVEKNTVMVSDEWLAYNGLVKNYCHAVINHQTGEYGRGIFHTNNIEGFWSLLKRGIVGIYHSVSPKHLGRYCNEFSYRYNTRKTSDNDRFFATLTRVEGRLKYRDLINKH